ncbi:hypothetical protein [Hymenobacter volaticus]|uniref:Uncharacterized protein n=1 Tax=Hymenobacter volaticus TaxID=2932254 RepID=A0ABY4GE96_9BACT|nr:hypothetical protein [Hymenobacter volaticus]UOQ69131.1 hypothetical protein MUN86_25790 [Hymenobacter volaticus]
MHEPRRGLGLELEDKPIQGVGREQMRERMGIGGRGFHQPVAGHVRAQTRRGSKLVEGHTASSAGSVGPGRRAEGI